MKYNPKISVEKSWKITPQIIFLIILGIIVVGGMAGFSWWWSQIRVPPPPEITPLVIPPVPKGNIQMPEGPVY